LRDAAPMIADPTPRKNIAVNEDIVSIFRLRIKVKFPLSYGIISKKVGVKSSCTPLYAINL